MEAAVIRVTPLFITEFIYPRVSSSEGMISVCLSSDRKLERCFHHAREELHPLRPEGGVDNRITGSCKVF